MMTIDEAVKHLRADPQYRDLVRDAYFDSDVLKSAERFTASTEFAEVATLLDERIKNSVVMDLGAGTGIASYAFAHSGASKVYAIEPDPSEEVGQGAIRRLAGNKPIQIITAFGEELPLPDGSVDIAFARQVLHHTQDLPKVMRECMRVLKSGGLLLVCREHVVDDAKQLAEFLDKHPVHQLTGSENAYSLEQYVSAIKDAGFKDLNVMDPWDSIINTFPLIQTNEELRATPKNKLREKFGALGTLAALVPGVNAMVWKKLRRPAPGRLYSFFAKKP